MEEERMQKGMEEEMKEGMEEQDVVYIYTL